jgi:hypothetical protein
MSQSVEERAIRGDYVPGAINIPYDRKTSSGSADSTGRPTHRAANTPGGQHQARRIGSRL